MSEYCHRSDSSLCQYHGSAIGCKYGNFCRYSHKRPESIPLCKYYPSANGCKYGPNCRYRHQEYSCQSSSCYQITRVTSALIFYSTIDPINNKKHESKLMEYCHDYYAQLLDDHIHIMDHHQDDIELVLNASQSDMELMKKCDIYNCPAITRHFRDRETGETVRLITGRCDKCKIMDAQCLTCSEETKELTFFIDILDLMHCHWYHPFDLEMRERKENIEEKTDDMRPKGGLHSNPVRI